MYEMFVFVKVKMINGLPLKTNKEVPCLFEEKSHSHPSTPLPYPATFGATRGCYLEAVLYQQPPWRRNE